MSAIDIVGGFRVGDTVFVGEPAPLHRKNTWKILSLWTAADDVAYATLTSGLTGRMSTVPVSRLRKFRLVEEAVA
ncbi:hypothetical protein ACI7YT_12690 [Microbacterium sp. M]|uniref:hypothetical protein n=1 Tax=Microbacterium sp. M TaxID=3377125 RepID=UPI00386DBAEE